MTKDIEEDSVCFYEGKGGLRFRDTKALMTVFKNGKHKSNFIHLNKVPSSVTSLTSSESSMDSSQASFTTFPGLVSCTSFDSTRMMIDGKEEMSQSSLTSESVWSSSRTQSNTPSMEFSSSSLSLNSYESMKDVFSKQSGLKPIDEYVGMRHSASQSGNKSKMSARWKNIRGSVNNLGKLNLFPANKLITSQRNSQKSERICCTPIDKRMVTIADETHDGTYGVEVTFLDYFQCE